jgi:hypothetical protein
MGLLDTHAEGIRQSFEFDLRNPAPQQGPTSFNAWSFASAGFHSPLRGAVEAGAGLADFAKMFQGEDASPLETDAQAAQRAAGVEARQIALGRANSSLRQRSAEMAPDPITAHRADQIISGIGSDVTQAAVSIGLTGPVAGSALFGGSKADQTYHDLVDSGVDPATAAKVAGVTGVVSGVTAAAPAGGSTVLRTLGIATAAGPASYVANETISRRILQSGGYTDQAAMHDPTDPLGLALSVALPGVAGALHIHGLKKSVADVVQGLETGGQKNPDAAVSPKGAEGRMQVMPETQLDPGFGVKPAQPGPDGVVSAGEKARVGRDYIAAMQDRYPGDTSKAMAAYNAGPGTVDAAIAKYGDEWLSHMPDETKTYVERGLKKLGDQEFAGAARDPEVIDAARVNVADEAFNEHLPDHPDAAPAVHEASDALAAGEFPEVSPAPLTSLPAFRDWFGDSKVLNEDGSPMVVYHGTASEFDSFDPSMAGSSIDAGKLGRGFYFSQDARWAGQYAENATRNGGSANVIPAHLSMRSPLVLEGAGDVWSKLRKTSKEWGITDDPVTDASNTPNHAWATRFTEEAKSRRFDGVILPSKFKQTEFVVFDPKQIKSAIGNSGRFDKHSASLTDPITVSRPPARNALPNPDVVAHPKPPTPEQLHAALTPEPPEPKPGAEKVQPPSLEVQRAQAALELNPDLRVQLPGQTETIHARDALAQVQAEADHEANFREVIRAAVQCALSFGD